jgi:hypothetical protein
MFEDIQQVAKLVTTLLGGGVVAWFWNWNNDRMAQYRYLDNAYRDILSLYAKNPRFADSVLTRDYKSSFTGDELLQYHCFSMAVHNFLETVFDVLWRPTTNKQWGHIFKHHAKLHARWLKDNDTLHEPGYVKAALAGSNTKLFASSASIAAVLCAVIGLAACTPKATQYTLRVDLSDQTNTQLCRRATDTDVKPGASPAPTCQPFGGQALAAPGTLTVKLEHASPQGQYDLRVSQFSREANPADAKKILENVVERVADLANKIGDSHGIQIVSDAAKQVEARAPDIAGAVVDKLGGPPPAPPPRPAPDKIFKALYFDVSAKKLKPAADSRTGKVKFTNEPAVPPPPRAYQLGAEDVTFLANAGVSADQLGEFVIDWCTPDSFQATADAPRYAALATAPQPDAVRKALDVSAQDVAKILLAQGNAEVVQARINALIIEGNDWDKASAAAKMFATMRLGKDLTSELKHCQDNLAYLGPKVSAAERAKLAAVAADPKFATLSAQALTYAKAFDDVFGPLLQDAFVEAQKALQLAGPDMSTTLTLEPGSLDLGVGQTDGAGKRTELASYRVPVRGIERLALLLGPTLTYCSWGCFDRVEEVAQQPATAGAPVHTVLDVSTHKHDFALATALHITFWRFAIGDSDFGLGGVLGYPLGSAQGTSSNVLIGLGLRHSSGIEISAGLHAFSSRVLKSAYKTPIDLSLNGNQGLTIDSVTEDTPQWALFVLIGFAPDVFSGSKE